MKEIVKKFLKILYQIIFLIIFYYDTNGQNINSLNNLKNHNPTGNTNISAFEFNLLNETESSYEKWTANITFTPSLLGFSELNQFSAGIGSLYWENTYFSSNINYLGFDLLNETSFNFSLAKRIEKVWLGTNLSISRISIKDFGNENIFQIDLFGKLYITDKMNIGFLLNNLNRAYYSNNSKTVNQNFILSGGHSGFYITPSGKIKMAVDIGANLKINSHSNLYFSTMFDFKNSVFLSAKVFSKPLTIYSGISFDFLSWMKISAFLKYQKEFSVEQTFSTEFYW